MPTIHPSAFVDPTSELADDVVVEAGAFVGPRCKIGPRTVIKRAAQVVQDTTLGADNLLHPFCVIGGDPQDKGYKPDNPGVLIVGDRNIFRECVTIGRSAEYGHGAGKPTRIGSGCYFMTHAHVGHNSVVEDNVILTNGSAIAGHCHVGRGVNLSGYTHIHQFCRVGALVMMRASAGVSMHVPPYVVVDSINAIAALNRIGLRRAGFSAEDRLQIKEAFRVIYRTPGPLVDRLAQAEQATLGAPARAFTDAIRATLEDQPPFRRGIVGPRWSRSRPRQGAEILD